MFFVHLLNLLWLLEMLVGKNVNVNIHIGCEHLFWKSCIAFSLSLKSLTQVLSETQMQFHKFQTKSFVSKIRISRIFSLSTSCRMGEAGDALGLFRSAGRWPPSCCCIVIPCRLRNIICPSGCYLTSSFCSMIPHVWSNLPSPEGDFSQTANGQHNPVKIWIWMLN